VLDCFTHQAIAELDQATLAAVRERLGTWVAQLDEEHLWRLGRDTLAFAVHGQNRHKELWLPCENWPLRFVWRSRTFCTDT
jgi:hypothetical protein